jgi:hypothetical protein
LFPILAFCILVYQLLHRGYFVSDYFWLIVDGQLNWARQGVMWVALIFWIARYWPAAWQAMRTDLLIVRTDRQVRLSSGVSLNLDDITSIERKSSLLFKGILFKGQGGELAKQSLLFSGAGSDAAIKQLHNYLAHGEIVQTGVKNDQ